MLSRHLFSEKLTNLPARRKLLALQVAPVDTKVEVTPAVIAMGIWQVKDVLQTGQVLFGDLPYQI